MNFINVTHCPTCGHSMDVASHPTDPTIRPKPNDYSLCLYCTGILIFNDDLSLRSASDEETIKAPVEVVNTQYMLRKHRGIPNNG